MSRWVLVSAGVVVSAFVVGAWVVWGGGGDEQVTDTVGVSTSVPPVATTVASDVSTTTVSPTLTVAVATTTTTVPARLDVAEAVGVSPLGVELPAPVDEDATVSFLESDGGPLVVFVAETADLFLVDVTNIELCETVAAGLDNAVAAPVMLSELASNVPDPVTSDLFLSDIALKTKLLGACGTDDASGLVAEVAWQSELLERRLVELGVEW